MRISKLMHRDVITCRIHDQLDRAAALLWEHDIGALPVIDDDGRVAGMVTDRDICMAAYTQGAPLRAIPVSSAMSKTVYSCTPDDELADVEKLMRARQVRRVPVIDQSGHPVAVVTLNDIARAAGFGAVPVIEVASTLAAVSAPRPMIVV